MKNRKISFYYCLVSGFVCLCMLSSCNKITEKDMCDPLYNYDELWRILDERYCYFEYKRIPWDSLYGVYRSKVGRATSTEEVFDIYCQLMAHLKDGHVNLYATFDVGRYWNWFLDYPRNFSEDVLDRYYLKNDFRMAASLKYLKMGPNKEVGYIRYANFSANFGEANLNQVLSYFQSCKGLIIDIRENGGGDLTLASKLASRFTEKSVLYGYIMHKTGKGHHDFSDPEPRWLNPSPYIRWIKPVVLLTNRYVFSTGNDFACMMKELPMVTLIGDSTGGGGGMPLNSELPCGWVFRYSAIPMLDANKAHTEAGIAPDIKISMDTNALRLGKDSMIDYALHFIMQQE
ncbi:MAG: S41 family peptidase [Bacteroidales bacterium]